MNKIKKIFNKKKKQAQHLVEFTILAPLFIAVFGALLPTMTSSFRHFSFSYGFENVVMSTINEFEKKLPPIGPIPTAEQYRKDIMDEISEKLENRAVITVFDMGKTDSIQSVFIHGAIDEPIRMFYLIRGKNHFYSSVPINRNLLEPTITPIQTDTLNSVFQDYYAPPSTKAGASKKHSVTTTSTSTGTGSTTGTGSGTGSTTGTGTVSGKAPVYSGLLKVPSGNLGE